MSQKVTKQIRSIAKNLPDVWIRKATEIRIVTDEKGKRTTHRKLETVKADHEARLNDVYALQGEAGVKKYCANAKLIGSKQARDLKKYPSHHPNYKMSFTQSRLQKIISFLKKIFFHSYQSR